MRAPALVAGLLAAVLGAGCDYARMRDDDALDTYQSEFPAKPEGTVPTSGGLEALRAAAPASLANPLPDTPAVLARGREAYDWYCLHCHGPRADGAGTVGQSFAPLPADLAGERVRSQTDGELFTKILFGFVRMPPLGGTLTQEEAWAVVRFVRSLPPGAG